MTTQVLTTGDPRLNLELALREPARIRRPKEKRQRRQRRVVVER